MSPGTGMFAESSYKLQLGKTSFVMGWSLS